MSLSIDGQLLDGDAMIELEAAATRSFDCEASGGYPQPLVQLVAVDDQGHKKTLDGLRQLQSEVRPRAQPAAERGETASTASCGAR